MEKENKLTVEKVNKVRRIIRYSVAGVTIILLLFLLIEGYKFYILSPEKLYAENYTPYTLVR